MSNANAKDSHSSVYDFLESLNKLQTPTGTEPVQTSTTNGSNSALNNTAIPDGKGNISTSETVMQFLDDIVKGLDDAGTVPKPATQANPQVTQATATATKTPTSAPAPAPVEQKEEAKKGWNWGSFWNNAQNTVNQASQNLKKGMEAAQKNIEGNETLRGIASQFNKENINKLGDGLKKMTVNVIDSIAPPIQGLNPDNETTLWIQINENKDFAEQTNDVIKYVVDEMFSSATVRKNVIKGKLNIKAEFLSKEKQQPVSVGINAAINTADDLFNELLAAHPKREPKVQQVVDDKAETPAGQEKPTKEIVTQYFDMFLFLQPFFINLTRPNNEKTLTHVAYYVLFYYPNYENPKEDIFISYTTQSVSCRENMENKDDDVNPLRSQIFEEWNDDRKLKVIEGGVWTVFEELLVRMKEYNYDAETIAGLTGQVI